MITRLFITLGATTLVVFSCAGQTTALLPPDSNPAPANDKRVLWIIPNYRTISMPVVYKPITAKEKFDLAAADSFDRGTFALAAVFAGDSQLTRSNPSFGNGMQ